MPWLSTISVDEFRTPAQHRGLTSGPIPSLNAWAHGAATGSLILATPWSVPPSTGLTDCIILRHRGALLLQLPTTLDAAYRGEADRSFWQRFSSAVRPWSGAALERQFLTGYVSSRQALQASRNRLYTWAALPPAFSAALCPLCGLVFEDMPRHDALMCVPQLLSLLLQTLAVRRVSAAAGFVSGPGTSLAVKEGTVLVSGVQPAFALAVLQRPTALPEGVSARPQWTAYTIGGLTAKAPSSVTPLWHHTRVLSAMAAGARAEPPPFDVVQASIPDNVAG